MGVRTKRPKDCIAGNAKAQVGQQENTTDVNVSIGVRTQPGAQPYLENMR